VLQCKSAAVLQLQGHLSLNGSTATPQELQHLFNSSTAARPHRNTWLEAIHAHEIQDIQVRSQKG
jgi:hypothetical protein